jgi:ketosteroid isomerase-like protein
MDQKKTILIAVAILGIGIGAALISRSKKSGSPEDEIRALIQSMAAAANEKDIDGIVDPISEKYRGTSENGDGEFNRGDLRERLMMYIMRGGGGGGVELGDVTVTVTSPTSATAQINAQVARRGGGAVDIAIDTGFEKEGSDWKLVSSHHSVTSSGSGFE